MQFIALVSLYLLGILCKFRQNNFGDMQILIDCMTQQNLIKILPLIQGRIFINLFQYFARKYCHYNKKKTVRDGVKQSNKILFYMLHCCKALQIKLGCNDAYSYVYFITLEISGALFILSFINLQSLKKNYEALK